MLVLAVWPGSRMSSLRERIARRVINSRIIPPDIRKFLASNLAPDETKQIDLGDGALFQYHLRNSYWLKYSSNIRLYEPEMWFAIEKFCNENTLFIDCGANAGLWSCYATSKIKKPEQVIAVEGSESVLPDLKMNNEINRNAFKIMQAIIWNKSHDRLAFSVTRNPVSGHVEEVGGHMDLLSYQTYVPTVSIDDIAASRTAIPGIVVKLDVEGSEIKALEGGKKSLQERNILIVYEDRYREKSCQTTEYLLANGMHIYGFKPGNCITRIRTTEELRGIKASRTNNFYTCKHGSEFDRILSEISRATRSEPGIYR